MTEFFEYGINTILFQRGVYPPEDFSAYVDRALLVFSQTDAYCSRRVKKYGLTMMTSVDDQVKAYIKKIMNQLSKWMQKSKISKLVVVITSKETGEHLERWQFDVSLFAQLFTLREL